MQMLYGEGDWECRVCVCVCVGNNAKICAKSASRLASGVKYTPDGQR